MVKSALGRLAIASSLALAPTLAFAHPGGPEAHGFVHGFAHPISGLDHILAMVLVGIFAWQLGGRALWLVPATFVTVMALGGGLGMAGINLPFVEIGIALSVVVLGAIVAFGVKAPVAAAMGIVGLFAVFHGYAHGAEMPESAGGLAYAAGFMLATAALHVAGIGVGFLIGKISETHGQAVVRTTGALAAVAGVGLLTGLV
ncbi:HupE/UreJ family protein [Kaistia dalseonensis]|uniref:Urease accessory protein n=1 Tax=Kaistia dalseonensis TaxID=410840 RepID=A0ABU0HCB4_9HYPH|nr:HupE/UreJ family protein [Kaistia dalseonensis]MCX5496780.1 HupE/UreJ family protein [Kaistia dalseonensis]MDQ0439405.1 urease accessory protein [Kaistia dalseonensis]